jgi:hypothetical protein
MDNNYDSKAFIKDKLDILDKSKSKFKNYISTKDVEFEIGSDDTKIIFKKNGEKIYSGKCSLLGVFDSNTKIWLWSWCLPSFSSDETIEARRILNYGLMLEPLSNSLMHYYIKSHLINSRLFFENEIFLDIHLGLSMYISKAKFIYPRIKDANGKKLVVYYLVY